MRLKSLRHKLVKRGLDEKSVPKNPFTQFGKWYREALNLELTDANAMTLATSSKRAKPSARIVLLKSFSENGFIFYTNYKSRKSNDLDKNPKASLLFFWSELRRQVRIEGKVKKISKKESEDYFHTRPHDTQIGAWASLQSSIIPGRASLGKKFLLYKKKFGKNEVPLPDFWGGYILIPHTIEFWQGRENRLHDRIVYVRSHSPFKSRKVQSPLKPGKFYSPFEGGKGDDWKIVRLAP